MTENAMFYYKKMVFCLCKTLCFAVEHNDKTLSLITENWSSGKNKRRVKIIEAVRILFPGHVDGNFKTCSVLDVDHIITYHPIN